MTEERGEPGQRWYATWFWRSLNLLGLGLALAALGEVRLLSVGEGVPPPILPDYTLLLPNFAVLLGFFIALVGAATALIAACAALLNALRRRHTASSRAGTRR